MTANIHVVASKNGGWDVKRDGAVKAAGHFDTKEEAVDFAKDQGKKNNVEVFIHGEDGKIESRKSFGKNIY